MKKQSPKFDFLNNNHKPLNIIGLNSGTSADGLDICLANFKYGKLPEILYGKFIKYPDKLKDRILECGEIEYSDGIEWMKLDRELGLFYGKSAKRFISLINGIGFKASIIASHGQTVRHIPKEKNHSLSLQIGDPSMISQQTGLPVIYDFRKSDLSAGGQGAPLSPLLHRLLFTSNVWTAVVNIGGISNITILPPAKSRQSTIACDCGPGNMTIDYAMKTLYGKNLDRDGKISASGNVDSGIVTRALNHPFFKARPPKSTGRELFGAHFTQKIIDSSYGIKKSDIIASLTMITVMGIAEFIGSYAPETEKIILCGGGAKNRDIVQRLSNKLVNIDIVNSDDLGFNSDYLEALLWAYLGYCFLRKIPVNTMSITGAKTLIMPGRLCFP